jgi:hypothetical protein
MITFTRVGNSVKVEIDTDVYYLTTDKVVYTRSTENKIYIQNEAAPNIKSYLSFFPTDVNGRPNDDLQDVAQFLVDDYFTGLSMSSTGGGGTLDDGSNPSIKATVLDYTNSNPLAVRLTDTNGDYVSAGGGTEYTEDNTAPANPVGNALLTRRRDSLSTETTTDGDITALNSTGKGELYVKHVDGIQLTDGAGTVNTKQLGTAVTNSDVGLIVNSVIHGLNSGGGGTFVDVKVNPSGSLETNNTLKTYATSAVTNVAASATNVTLLASNTSRVGAMFFNDSTSAAYLKLGATASTSSFTVKMASNSYYELPIPIYTGIIDCIWDSATGNMRITQIS